MTPLQRVAADKPRGHRFLWAGAAWILAAVLGSLGVSYALGGMAAASSTHAYEVVVLVPGGMRTHGAIMAALGAALLYGLLAPAYGLPMLARLLSRVLACVAGYASWLVIAFVGAWADTGTPTTGACVWWAACVGFAALLILAPPPTTTEGRGRARRGATTHH